MKVNVVIDKKIIAKIKQPLNQSYWNSYQQLHQAWIS